MESERAFLRWGPRGGNAFPSRLSGTSPVPMTSRIRCTVRLRRARSRPLSFSLLRRILRGVAAVLRRSGTLRRILRRVLRRRHRGSRRPRYGGGRRGPEGRVEAARGPHASFSRLSILLYFSLELFFFFSLSLFFFFSPYFFFFLFWFFLSFFSFFLSFFFFSSYFCSKYKCNSGKQQVVGRLSLSFLPL